MAHDVYLLAFMEDYITFHMVDEANWQSIHDQQCSLGDAEFEDLVIRDLVFKYMDPDEREESEHLADIDLTAWFSLDNIIDMVKNGDINVLGTAEGLQL